MQYSVAAYYLLNAMWAVAAPFLLAGTMSDYMSQLFQRNAALNPDVPPPPPEVLSTITSFMTVGLAVGAFVKMFKFRAVNVENHAKAGVSTKPLDGTLIDLELRLG